MNVHQVQVSDDRFVLAFYGLDPSHEAGERFFLTAAQWMESLGYPAACVVTSGKP
jgi:hypothetical protein